MSLSRPKEHSARSIDRKAASSGMSRRTVLAGAAAAVPAALIATAAGASTPGVGQAPDSTQRPDVVSRIRELERGLDGEIGVHAFDTSTGACFGYRDRQPFLLCSVSKVLVAATVLDLAADDPQLLGKRLTITQDDLLPYAPVTSQHLEGGMTVEELCAAALTVSDNTASNLLLEQCGGPETVTAFVRSTGDVTTRLDRIEPDLNDASGTLDTTTPAAFSETLNRLTLGDALAASGRDKLVGWMKESTTGAEQIRAGLPEGTLTGDKTGSGTHGESNDVAVIWPKQGAPVIMSVFTKSQRTDDTTGQKAAIAGTARAVFPLVVGG
ncbi:class A beta-lactamase [Rothia uropygialis]|uniref:class A beta-lactamase n=1 Tax=Kocuria sp. 36 TaxID=1415402 RepID=UPI00101D43A7|nr:class A beta-lactamase [Kocuria sp. 36]